MSWKEKMKEFGGGNFAFLSTDGEALTFIVVGDPILLHSKYKGQEQERIGCPVVTGDGYQLLIIGKRAARKISKHEALFGSNALMITRNGAEGDTNAKYPVVVLPEPETYTRLRAIAERDFKPEMIQESVDEVAEAFDS